METEASKKPHMAKNTGNNEWYTPHGIIQAARDVMGGIDLDPATSGVANCTVLADRYYTAEDDGLTQPWHGRVWLNPPYAQPLCAQFCERVAGAYQDGEIDVAIVLLNNATETKWFQRLLGVASAACFHKGRIRFVRPHGEAGSPLQGQAIFYLGKQPELFGLRFGCMGQVVLPYKAQMVSLS